MAEYSLPGLGKQSDEYMKYYDVLSKKLTDQLGQIEYNPTSASALKDALAKSLRPDYDKAIGSLKKQAATNRALVDVDAASRGMGSSTWVTDAKGRQNQAALGDIAGMENNYIQTLYGNLLDQLNQQENRRIGVEQSNMGARQAALQNALSLAGQLQGMDKAGSGGGKGVDLEAYLRWLKEQNEKKNATIKAKAPGQQRIRPVDVKSANAANGSGAGSKPVMVQIQ